jgi:cob(I)alamin adenosyltransferase
MKQGYIQIYTGNGKGKTTAAIGLTVRALGNGLRVFFGQFLKEGAYSEIKALKQLQGMAAGRLRIEQFGSGRDVNDPVDERDYTAALSGIETAEAAMNSGNYDLIILDEFNLTASMKLVPEARLKSFLELKPGEMELVLTGRNAPGWLVDRADLVTEMTLIKHYFEKGVAARRGIEM